MIEQGFPKNSVEVTLKELKEEDQTKERSAMLHGEITIL